MVIEFDSVGKTFRDGTAAVVDLSLTVPSDQITVVVGPSGCGKTTTLRMVNRMIEPSKGKITWDGTPLRSKRKTTLRRQMGYVIQSGGLFPHRTVVENIGTVPGLLGWSKSKTRKRSLELLDSVGLDRKLADRFPVQLSGGQQQRVGVARALAADPLVMLMDEPFSAVDPVVRSELHEFFLNLQRELSKTIILITHDIEEAIKLGDQVAILRVGGKLAQVGTPQQLLDEPADAFVEGFVGRDRGYRSLSFKSAGSLAVDRVKVVRDADSARGPEPTLVVDGDARPLGWADPDHAGTLLPLGSTFRPESDTLRAALDSALTSPYGLAVAVETGSGRYAGVVSAQTILGQVNSARVESGESVTVSEPQPEVRHEPSDSELTAVRPQRAAETAPEIAAGTAPETAAETTAAAPVAGTAVPTPAEPAANTPTTAVSESTADPVDPEPAASPSDPAPPASPSEPDPGEPTPAPSPAEPSPQPVEPAPSPSPAQPDPIPGPSEPEVNPVEPDPVASPGPLEPGPGRAPDPSEPDPSEPDPSEPGPGPAPVEPTDAEAPEPVVLGPVASDPVPDSTEVRAPGEEARTR